MLTSPGWTKTGLLVVLVFAGGALAACRTPVANAGGSPPAGSTSGTHTPAAAPPSSTSPATAQPPPCRRPGVVVSVGGQDAGSGHRSVTLVFTNAGGQPCQLSGYPGVAGLDAVGSQVAQARRTPSGYLGGLASGSAPTVTLSPGRSASARVEALAFNAADGSACTAFGGLLVTAPDDTVSTRLPWGNDGCGDLQVHPVVPGTTGRSG